MTDAERSDVAVAYLKALPYERFLALLQLAGWAVDGCKEHGLEMVYQDAELILFRRKKP